MCIKNLEQRRKVKHNLENFRKGSLLQDQKNLKAESCCPNYDVAPIEILVVGGRVGQGVSGVGECLNHLVLKAIGQRGTERVTTERTTMTLTLKEKSNEMTNMKNQCAISAESKKIMMLGGFGATCDKNNEQQDPFSMLQSMASVSRLRIAVSHNNI